MHLPQIELVGIYNSQLLGPDNHTTKRRNVTLFEIELPIDEGGLAYIDNECVPIRPNMIICAKPGQVRNTKYPFKCYYVHLFLEHGYLYDTLMEFPSFFSLDHTEPYLRIFKKLCKYYETRTKQDEIMQQSLILELIHLLCIEKKSFVSGSIPKRNRFDINNALKYIKENLTEDLSLQAVSTYMNYSPIHFHNTFKKVVGATLHEYVEEQRIKAAINMLLTTDLNLTEIAMQCGFSSQSYFSYVFKRQYGISPTKYKQNKG